MAAARGKQVRTGGTAKASTSTEPPSPPKVVSDPEHGPNWDHLYGAMLDQLRGDICGKIDSLSSLSSLARN